ncbi:MAG TPA: methyltransferase domain-containing protein [Frankiaceae bacterium]|nr:methyltransferase domain-containing protein [Frankiaceae bacterium]
MSQRSRSPFDALVDSYDAARPSYPGGLYAALPPLAGRRVADVGAGTGIATRGLLAHGADVLAFDIGAQLLARLRANGSPGPGRLLGAAVADAHALPLPDAGVDLVTYAQVFHWVRHDAAAAEARRVLRPGGALAVWWNDSAAQAEGWWRAQQQMLEVANRSYARDYRVQDVAADLRTAFADVRAVEVPWERRLDLDTYLVYLRSKSYVAALGDALGDFLDAQRALLAESFPDGVVVEPFVTRLWLAAA